MNKKGSTDLFIYVCYVFKMINRREATSGNCAAAKLLFVLALLVTLVSLLTPGELVLAFKQWVYTWVPFAAQIDAADMSQNSDKLVHAT
jgi:uncharacterized membrane protein YobD (UPF0266 family)